MKHTALNKQELFRDKFYFTVKGERRNSMRPMMWNTCEQLHALKQQKYKGDLPLFIQEIHYVCFIHQHFKNAE